MGSIGWWWTRRALGASALALGLAACGGGGGGSSTNGGGQTATGGGGESAAGTGGAGGTLMAASVSDAEAHRFLRQASFGPNAAEIARVKSMGYSGWIDDQMGRTLRHAHVATVDSSTAVLSSGRPRASDIVYSWWTHAVQDPAQLRQRVAFALSQIFVVSTIDADLGDRSRVVANYMDMLTERSTGTYRQLLEGVALHPAMGHYLSHLRNMKEDPASGRVPDENFAREVMQLFSIGLYELNDDGSIKLRDGRPVETYTSDDVKGLAKVFTGWAWHRPAGNNAEWWKCAWAVLECANTEWETQPMSAYPEIHSTAEKRFLGVVVPAQSPANPQASLKAALDRLASHANTAPFISKQLIQRLVTSNPSPAYVARVVGVWRSTAGYLPAVIKAILLDAEARQPATAGVDMTTYGKLREPLLRIAHLLRAVPHTSSAYQQTGIGDNAVPFYLAQETDSPAYALGQTPMRSPSVFNFYRPGYKPPQTQLASRGLVAPEMQGATETSVLGYANFVATALDQGWGLTNGGTNKPDIQFDLSGLTALDDGTDALRPQRLVTEAARLLTGQALPTVLNEQIVTAVGAMPRSTEQQRRRRAAGALLMVAASPAFIVQQ